jgi:hypothetical protein
MSNTHIRTLQWVPGFFMARYSVVGIANRYGLDEPGIETR